MSAHSEKYENVISLAAFKENKELKQYEENRALIHSLCHVRKIYLLDGTPAQMNHYMNMKIVDYGIDDSVSQKVFVQAIRQGILLYCSMINRDKLNLREAGTMIDICLMAINLMKDDGHKTPFVIDKKYLTQASENWNKLFLGK